MMSDYDDDDDDNEMMMSRRSFGTQNRVAQSAARVRVVLFGGVVLRALLADQAESATRRRALHRAFVRSFVCLFVSAMKRIRVEVRKSS